MKRVILLISLLYPFLGESQIPANINLNNTACGYYSTLPLNLSGTNTFVISNNGSYIFKSAAAVHIPPSTHISTSSSSVTGIFNASISNNQLDAIIMYPANPNTVPQFSKLELGINLSSILSVGSINSRISKFLNDPIGDFKPGTANYIASYNDGQIVNPYDPEQISVDVVFYRPSSPNENPVIRYGFYYRGAALNADLKDWHYVSNDPYTWRARFAPDEIGTWNGYVNVYVGGKLVQENKAFSFTVAASSNQGFVQKGPNPRYLQYSGSGESYIPVGNAYPYTGGSELHNCNTLNCSNLEDHRINPHNSAELETFIYRLTNQPAGNGGNCTRLLMAPFGLQIEFEKLGNYDSRQVEMLVLDQYIDLLEQNNVTLILGQLVADISPTPSWQKPAEYSEGWDGNPYNGTISNEPSYPFYKFKGIQGIVGVGDLFNPLNAGYAKAFQLFKNRWRYIESRWGYSTAISTYEFVTELPVSLEWFNSGNDANFANWCNNLSQYLKEGLGSKHLTTVSYGQGAVNEGLNPYIISPTLPQSHVWSKPYIDVLSAHRYFNEEHGLRETFTSTIEAKNAYPSKPALFNETDADFFDIPNLCTDIVVHNHTWSSMFSGAMAPHMMWEQRRYTIELFSKPGNPFHYMPYQPNGPYYGEPNTYSGEYQKNYPAFRTFIHQIDFRNSTYLSYVDIQPTATPYYEIFYMVDNAKQKAYGWLHNRSFNNFRNVKCLNNTDTYDNMSVFRENPRLDDVDSSRPLYVKQIAPQTTAADGGFNYNKDKYVTVFGTGFETVGVPSKSNVFIKNLEQSAHYDVIWYWTWGTNGGQSAPMYTTSYQPTDGAGSLVVTTPPTGTTNGILYPGDWAFKITKVLSGPTGVENRIQRRLMVSPNPSSDVFVISDLDGLQGKGKLKLFDVSGRLIREENVPDVNGYSLDLKNNDDGIYILKVTVNENEVTLKLIKNAN